jgi:hypothetical protein
VPQVDAFLVLLNFLEDPVLVFRHLLLQFFHLPLELAALSHRNLVRHVEVALILRVVAHEGAQSTSGLACQMLVGLSSPFLLLLYLPLHLLDELPARCRLVFYLNPLLNLNLAHC